MKDRLLLLGVLAGVLAGGLFGWLDSERATSVAWLGDLFLSGLKMLVLPLVFCSLVDAVAGMMGGGNLRRVAGVAFLYYFATTLLAVLLGLALVSWIRPGEGLSMAVEGVVPSVEAAGVRSIAESILTPNLFAAAVHFQVLPILAFALFFGLALALSGEQARGAVAFFHGCNVALLKLVDWLMFAAPVGVAALVAGSFGRAGGGEAVLEQIAGIGYYCLTVLLGLALHAGFVLPAILFLVTGRAPWRYAVNLLEALVTAFATASSSATLAVTMRLSEERNGIEPATASFVLPLGATINMDGTALYEAVAAIFIAEAWGVPLSPGSQVVIVLTATLASIGAAGIPQAGLVTMVLVLNAVGLPLEGISAILAVDWFLDRCRTAVNVWGDTVGAAVVDTWAIRHN